MQAVGRSLNSGVDFIWKYLLVFAFFNLIAAQKRFQKLFPLGHSLDQPLKFNGLKPQTSLH